MSLNPDYGVHIRNIGLGHVAHFFYDFPADHIAIVGPLQFSVMSVLTREGVDYALSLDLDSTRLDQLLDVTPDFLTLLIADEMQRDPYTCRAIEFPESVSFGVEARLGRAQEGGKEAFIPFVAVRIFRAA